MYIIELICTANLTDFLEFASCIYQQKLSGDSDIDEIKLSLNTDKSK